jgi:hypothetical protein
MISPTGPNNEFTDPSRRIQCAGRILGREALVDMVMTI